MVCGGDGLMEIMPMGGFWKVPVCCFRFQMFAKGCLEWGQREIYAGRPFIVLQRGNVRRIPWCEDYTEPLPFCLEWA